jgi:hypothetical protein
VEDEEEGERIFQRSAEVDEEKQQYVITAHLYVKAYTHLISGEVPVLEVMEIDVKDSIKEC